MKCDGFLPWRATGPWWCRLRAWRHGRRCPRCQAAARALDAWQIALRAPEPLPNHLRALWSASWTEDAVARPTWMPRLATLVVAGGAVVGLAGVYWLAALLRFEPPVQPASVVSQEQAPWGAPIAPALPRGEALSKNEDRYSGPTQALARQPAPELNRLLHDVDALQAELATIATQAKLLDARRQADVLIAKYGQW